MFTYNDVVRVKADSPAELRPGARAWIIGITAEQDRQGSHFKPFPAGIVYLVEFEDGTAIDLHENMLETEMT